MARFTVTLLFFAGYILKFGPVVQEGMSFFYLALGAILFNRAEPIVQFLWRIFMGIPMKLF